MNKNDIFWFDVPMEDLVLVHETDCIEQISDHKRSSFFRKKRAVRDDVVKLTIGSELENDIEMSLVTKTSINFDYVRML
jgi:hypothetical protein